jgi:osmotically-inducible protein OsmY
MKEVLNFYDFFDARSLMATEACMEIREPEGGARSDVEDSVITAKIKTLFLDEPKLSYDELINVETFKGVVHLSGVLDSRIDIKRAVEVALGVNGVNSVKNEIQRK